VIVCAVNVTRGGAAATLSMSPVVSHSAVNTGGAPGVKRSRNSMLAISVPPAPDHWSLVIVAGFAAENVTVLSVGGGVLGPPDR
jgi:hypothetical protein